MDFLKDLMKSHGIENPLDLLMNTSVTKDNEMPDNCPFCGAKPKMKLSKKTYCQLHGEPSQKDMIYCDYPQCAVKPVMSYGLSSNPNNKKEAIKYWNTRVSDKSPIVGGDVKEALDALKMLGNAALNRNSMTAFGVISLSEKIERAITQSPALDAVSKSIHYPECWDVAAYPTVNDALAEMYAWFKCDNPEHTAAPATSPDDGWMPIETAPKDGTAILGFVKSDVSDDTWQDVIYYKDFCDKFFSGTRLVNPTHWMSLPQPPTMQGE